MKLGVDFVMDYFSVDRNNAIQILDILERYKKLSFKSKKLFRFYIDLLITKDQIDVLLNIFHTSPENLVAISDTMNNPLLNELFTKFNKKG